MTRTQENVQAAFAGESQASTKYLAFARVADSEGHPQVARLFRAAAAAEQVHARNHLQITGAIKSTADNLETAIAGENYEHTQMYPQFIQQARADNDSQSVLSFHQANAVEQIHERLYRKALEALKGGKTIVAQDCFVCQVCGNTVEGQPPETCPICGSPKSQFRKIA